MKSYMNQKSKLPTALLAVCVTLLTSLSLGAQEVRGSNIAVSGAYSKATVAGQMASSGFMKITSTGISDQLVGVSSQVAGEVQLHSMSMEGNTMKMAPVAEMKLEPQVPLQLAPGGYHLMLMDLKPEFAKATTVPLTLTFKDMKGEEVQKEVEVPITMNPPQAPNAAPEHMHMHM